MRQVASVWIMAAVLALLVMHQNCDTYPSGGRAETTPSLSISQNPEAVQLEITSMNPLVIKINATAFDVAGTCYTSDYPNNRISWSVSGTGFNLASNGATETRCDSLGRYRFRVDLPQGFNYNANYQITAELFALNGTTVVTNPLQLNRKQIGLLAR